MSSTKDAKRNTERDSLHSTDVLMDRYLQAAIMRLVL